MFSLQEILIKSDKYFLGISLYINELCIITNSLSNISWIRGIPNLGF